jgi:site-specific recombinase XerD
MIDKNDYFKNRNSKTEEKIDELLAELPSFCMEFIYGISNNSTPLTRLNYVYDLRIFFFYLSKLKRTEIDNIDLALLESLTAFDIERFLNFLSSYTYNGVAHTCNERGKARKLATIRALYKYFYDRDRIKTNVSTKVKTPKIHDKEIVRLENDEVERLLDYAESDTAFSGRKNAYHSKLKVRDFAILMLMLGTGIRISELVGLNVDDFDFDKLSFVVTRKGGNQTTLYFNEEVRDALEAWLDYRYDLKDVSRKELAMFLSLKNQRISVRSVQVLVKAYSQEVTPLKKITPHKLRSTFGTNLYRITGDIYAVADFLGHKDVNTTKKHYAAISEDSRKRSADIVKLRNSTEDNNH